MKRLKAAVKFVSALVLFTIPAMAGSITTTFADNNGFSGNMFSVTVGANPITLTSLLVNVDSGALTIDVYLKTGTYVGFETTPAAWTLESTTAVNGLGEGKQTPVTLTPFSLTQGNLYSLYITIDPTATGNGKTMYYTTGASTYSNSDLSLALGDGIGGFFGSSAVFPNRTWDGTINYTIKSAVVTPEPASLLLFAAALPGLLALRKRKIA